MNKNQHNFIYLDNSLSTKTEGGKGDLLQVASQEIIENISDNDKFSLLTNDNIYSNLTSSELKKILFEVKNTAKKLSLKDVLLKIESQNTNKTNALNRNLLISDFQNTYKNKFTNVNSGFSLIQQQNSLKNNISIDSVFINENDGSNFTLNIKIKNQGVAKKNIPIAIFNNEKLVSKQSFSIEKDNTKLLHLLFKINLLF